MKRNIIIFGTLFLACSITTFGYIKSQENAAQTDVKCESGNQGSLCLEDFATVTGSVFARRAYQTDDVSKSNFFYDVDSRFMTTVTKSQIKHAKSLMDLLPADATASLQSFRNVKLAILTGEGETLERGNSEKLNTAQQSLLASMDYSTNFYIKADCQLVTPGTEQTSDYDFVYYVTVIPEKEAEFKGGKQAIINYLKQTSDYTSMLDPKKLQSGKIEFVVSSTGKIENVHLNSTSGYESVDEQMLELIEKMPERWTPAQNENGTLIDQQFVFSFGLIGC